MIILKHLTIERFRLLRSMNLHFPQRGSILIQGPNEAGKSALIESIFFALYGESLSSHRAQRSLDDLILYGAADAVVSLTLSVGATELTVSRTIERGRGQRATLLVQQLGMPDEAALTDLAAVNERIICELGHLNGETLRDSGLVEQKGLTRLETLPGAARERTIRNLLGLDALIELSDQFQVKSEDEERLRLRSERLSLAEIQAHIPQVQVQLVQLEVALDAVQVNEHLADIDQQEVEIGELEQTLERMHSDRLDLKSRLGRVQQLKKADATLAEIIASYDDIAEARRESPALEQQISDLERREREELPTVEKRVSDLAELARSFGTLQRMSNDLLTAVDSIKELEQDLKSYQDARQNLQALDAQISEARSRLASTQKQWQELEEHRRSRRPQLEDRLQRLLFLAERLAHLRDLEGRYTRRVSGRPLADENEAQLRKVWRDLGDMEQEQELLESEAQQVQQQAERLELSWRQLNIHRQMEEWHRLKGLSQGLVQAEQHVYQARQYQTNLTNLAMDARKKSHRYMGIIGACVLGLLVFLVLLIATLSSNILLAIFSLLCFLALLAVGFVNFQHFRKASLQESTLKLQEQDAISRVGMMVTAREAALRMAGSDDPLRQVEHEIVSMGGTIPTTLEEAQLLLDRKRDQDDLGNVQQQMQLKMEAAQQARNQVQAMLESVTALRQEQSRLEEQRKQEQWDNMDEILEKDQNSVELMQQEITLLAGQENLPMSSINARIQASPIPLMPSFSSGPLAPVVPEEDTAGVPELESLVESTIKATEHEIVSLDGKLDLVADLSKQVKLQQESLDILFVRRHSIEDLFSRYESNSPERQIEHAREQQVELRSALQSLQDSLRQRVKPLGVAFGQAAVGNAETGARKQLEELHIILGNKMVLQGRHQHYADLLKDRQESLSEHYKQLAKFSNTLGSWIVPLNPFAEALVALRTRCQKELIDANEEGINQHLASLLSEEGASMAKIQLCQQEIAGDQAVISQVFVAHDFPTVESYARSTLIQLWPLLAEYAVTDRERLEDEHVTRSQELADLAQQEQDLAQRLQTVGEILDLAQARSAMEDEERVYQTKKHGYILLQDVEQRLLQKVQPRTEFYMQQFLPLLTGGRYHDVHLVTEAEEGSISGGSFQIQVWDTAAGEYVPTSVLSGGASDLLSLALRLAFAISSLPKDLNAAPGFVLLDEPLSSFDRGRAQALVDVVTGEVFSEHFEQIILLSHSSAFDPAMFPYHIYMDNGLIVESNLPVVSLVTPTAPMLNPNLIPFTPLPDDFDDDYDGDATVAVAAIKLPLNNK